MNAKIGFIGLGRMGRGMVRNLLKANLPIMVYDHLPEPRKAFTGLCPIASNLDQLFDFCEILMLSLPASEQVEEVVSRYIMSGVKGKTIVDYGTSLPSSTIELAGRVESAGGVMLDAPLGGGPVQAESGELTVMVGGDKKTFDRLLPTFQTIAKSVFYVGKSGHGHIFKLAANYLSILYIALYAEILPFAEKLGVDTQKLFEVISTCGANSPMFQVAAPRIINDEYEVGFQMDLAIKDLSYVQKLFAEHQAPSPMLNAGLNLFRIAKCEGLAKGDTSEVARLNKRLLALNTKDTVT